MEGDIFKYEMLNYLNISDIMKVRELNKLYYKDITIDYIKQRIIKDVETRLAEIFGPYWMEFKEQCEKSGAIISGSFLIQCILNEDWKTDIDIYISSTINREKFKKMHHGAKKTSQKMREIELWLINNGMINTRYMGSDRYNEGISQDIRCVRNYGFCREDKLEEYKNVSPYDQYANYSRFVDQSKPQIQIIQVNRDIEEILEFIMDNFDLDICKNAYISKGQKIYISNLNQIISKINCTGFGYNSKLTLARYKKYMKYGFKFPEISLKVYQKFIDRSEDFYLFSIKEYDENNIEELRYFKLIKGNKNIFTPNRSGQYFSIDPKRTRICFRTEYLTQHNNCDICSLIKNTFNFDCYYHFNVSTSFKKPVEFIFVIKP